MCTSCVQYVVSRPLPCSRDRSDVVSMLIPCVHLAYMVANGLPCSSNGVGHGINADTMCTGAGGFSIKNGGVFY